MKLYFKITLKYVSNIKKYYKEMTETEEVVILVYSSIHTCILTYVQDYCL